MYRDDNKPENWFECNESKIDAIDKNIFIKNTFGDENNNVSRYMLFYEKLNEINCFKFDNIDLIIENWKIQ